METTLIIVQSWDTLERLASSCPLPIIEQFPLTRQSPFPDKATRNGRQAALDDLARFDGHVGLMPFRLHGNAAADGLADTSG